MSHIVDKIQKLLAMANDDSLSEEIAALYAAKAADLLAANNLSMSDVVTEDADDGLIEQQWETMYLDPWRRRLIRASAQLYFCDNFLRKWWDKKAHRLRDGVVLIGRPHNIFIAKMMATYLIDTTMRLAIDYSHKNPTAYFTPRGTRLAFERGCGEKLAWRLHELRKSKSAGEQIFRETNPGNLPALYATEADLAKKYIESLGLKNAKVRGSDLSTIHSKAGVRAANAISLEPQITQTPTNLLENKDV